MPWKAINGRILDSDHQRKMTWVRINGTRQSLRKPLYSALLSCEKQKVLATYTTKNKQTTTTNQEAARPFRKQSLGH